MVLSSKGTLIQFGDDSSPITYATLAQLRSFSFSGLTANIQDITVHNGGGFWMSKLATILDPGSLSAPVNFDPSQATHSFATGVWDQLLNLSRQAIKVLMPSTFGALNVDGFASGHSFDFNTNEVIAATMEFALTDSIAWSAS